MRVPGLDVERNRPGRRRGLPARARLNGAPGSIDALLRRPLLALPLALALGGCTMVQADPIDRAAIGPFPSIRASAPRAVATEVPEDSALRLRLTHL